MTERSNRPERKDNTDQSSRGRFNSSIGMLYEDRIFIRGIDLVEDLMPHVTFTEMIGITVLGRELSSSEVSVLDAALVALVDHGLTPSSIVARLTYASAPEAFQGAIAAGLLNAGGEALGTMESCGKVLSDWAHKIDDNRTTDAIAADVIEHHQNIGEHIPGFGHRLYKTADPRVTGLLSIVETAGHAGRYVDLIRAIEYRLQLRAKTPIPINITGAIAAILLELGADWRILKGFSLISRIVGLVAHVEEEALGQSISTDIREILHHSDEDERG